MGFNSAFKGLNDGTTGSHYSHNYLCLGGSDPAVITVPHVVMNIVTDLVGPVPISKIHL